MDFARLESVLDASVAALQRELPLAALPAGKHASMRYPKFPPVMRFAVRQYASAGYGNVCTMYTRALCGLMQLATIVCTPNAGAGVPLLLVDVMAMGGKRAAFVEYYDCTATGADCSRLEDVAARYGDLPAYPEKPAWYIAERAPYSLIKGGTDDARLIAMLRDSVAAYAATCATQTAFSQANLEGLGRFVDRMAAEGNPSSATMQRVLGKDGAERFFRAAVMPATYTTKAI